MDSGYPAEEVIVRRMTLQDLDAVRAIDQASFSTPWPRYAFLHELTRNSASHLWVAERGHAERGHAEREDERGERSIVGMIAVWRIADEIHIGTLATHPAHRRQGIARRLLIEALVDSAERGARLVTLEVRESNQAAQELYRGFGFEVVGRRKGYYHDNNEDALLMTLPDLQPEVFRQRAEAVSNFSGG